MNALILGKILIFLCTYKKNAIQIHESGLSLYEITAGSIVDFSSFTENEKNSGHESNYDFISYLKYISTEYFIDTSFYCYITFYYIHIK